MATLLKDEGALLVVTKLMKEEIES